MARLWLFAVLASFAGLCRVSAGPEGLLAIGTWGGANAGVVVSGTDFHVHIGCTLGDAPRPASLDEDGAFEVQGRYNVTAHPVDLGVYHPARFSGRVRGTVLILTVHVTDLNQTLGPVAVVKDREPQMGPCPICRPRQ